MTVTETVTESQGVEPFYFKSYDTIIGEARNLNDLQREFTRLAKENPEALEYHLKEGHIVEWLGYLNEKELAEQLKNAKSVDEARMRLANHLESVRLRATQKTRAPVAQKSVRRTRR